MANNALACMMIAEQNATTRLMKDGLHTESRTGCRRTPGQERRRLIRYVTCMTSSTPSGTLATTSMKLHRPCTQKWSLKVHAFVCTKLFAKNIHMTHTGKETFGTEFHMSFTYWNYYLRLFWVCDCKSDLCLVCGQFSIRLLWLHHNFPPVWLS